MILTWLRHITIDIAIDAFFRALHANFSGSMGCKVPPCFYDDEGIARVVYYDAETDEYFVLLGEDGDALEIYDEANQLWLDSDDLDEMLDNCIERNK